MKYKSSILGILCFLSAFSVFSQQPQTVPIATDEQIEKISRDMSKVVNSVEDLNKQMKEFFKTFTTNQGIKLSDKQQKLLFAFEILNRAEQRLSTLQTLKVALAERQSATRLTIARINYDLIPESVDKYVAVRGGSTNAEQLRQSRRQALEKEKYEMTKLLSELDDSVDQINAEMAQLQMFLRNVRQRIFGEINNEINGL